MKQIEIVVQNRTGLHARPAKVLVNLAKKFKSDIHIQYNNKRVNAKSMVSVLTLGAACGSEITLQVDGADEETALAELESAIRAGLGDDISQAEPKPVPIKVEAPVESPKVDEIFEPGVIKGVGAAPGIAVGPIFHFKQTVFDLEKLNKLPTENQIGLDEALNCAKVELAELYQQMTEKKLGAEAAIFEAHSELLDDTELTDVIRARISAGEIPAKAWKATIDERAASIAALDDPLLAARADDLRDVGKRVLRLMLGLTEKGATPETPVVIVARELSPSDTASFDPEHVLGFGIVEGGPTSHIAILARALGLPAIVGVDESMLALEEQTPVILNGNDGTLTVNPAADVLERARQSQRRWLEYRRFAQEQASQPAISQDGQRVDVTANAGSVADAAEALHMGADGIGLLRTEFLFLERTTAPTEDEQFAVYNAIAETMRTLPVIVRTLDIGGDKPLPYIHLKPELNPFLGERGIRLCLNRPELFREQLRAILRAAPSGNLKIMFPMVSDIAELRQSRVLIEELCRELNVQPVQIGIMVEVPSAALMAEIFAPEIDFFSIGTNDLTQYTLAIDRGNSTLASKHDGLHPSVLRLIAHTIESAHKFGKRADICGELGSDSAAVPILLGLGMDELSVSIPSVPTVKAQVRSLTIADWQPLAKQALDCSTAQEVRDLVKKHIG
ncbi:PTS system, fructose-specific IIA component,PTS-EI.PTSI, ptsI; phosphotransferase system, enzyme I, PtsI,PTS-HPR.FRUB, fruB, fpr; phosphocarrier protein FPr [Anaerolineales bacterium]|nr:PTS system, fructose-specific IIA component,PTS-EI.PTSI, ptsI; phosphotransferase system, enzyme I, PtsI,PTS-HPR.FRUB, fruB, fpr; phosphocarrier protein FPr [Anaerolineales bacterium]